MYVQTEHNYVILVIHTSWCKMVQR